VSLPRACGSVCGRASARGGAGRAQASEPSHTSRAGTTRARALPPLPDLIAAARAWADADPDPFTRAAALLLAEQGDEAALRERFGARLRFGTAGLRGPLGPGPNAMNRALVRRVSLGLGLHLRAQGHGEGARVAVGFDARFASPQLAEECARALGGLGFEVHLAPSYCPTPLLAFAVLRLGAVAGAMVTASHNPPQDNGFKVYWGDGAQVVPPHDDAISAAADALGDPRAYPRPELEELMAAGRVVPMSEEVGDAYERALLTRRLGAPALAAPLRVAYTAMHGVGAAWFRRLMPKAGFVDLVEVAEQVEPDPRFPTVAFPNPEEPGALDLARATAARAGAHILLAHDPDADRLAVVARDAAGAYRAFTGDQVGALVAHELFEVVGARPEDLVATSIVSSSLVPSMARARGCACAETLTGFKWIAHAALAHQARAGEAGGRFLFGYEEAIGYSVGDLVRDKDGVSAALCVADMAARALAEGKTLWDRLDEVYARYGLYLSGQVSRARPGAAGQAEIAGWMRALRAAPPTSLAGRAVEEITDFARLPAPLTGDVVRLRLAGGARVLVRPSGTEPKIKLYVEVRAEVGAGGVPAAAEEARAALDALKDAAAAALLGG